MLLVKIFHNQKNQGENRKVIVYYQSLKTTNVKKKISIEVVDKTKRQEELIHSRKLPPY
jgi:hypothetical protein